jgi:hypothetical protein
VDLKGFGKVVQELQEFDRNKRVRIVPHHRSLTGGHRVVFSSEGGGTRIDHELELMPKRSSIFSPMRAGSGGKTS